nr:terminase [Stenotrophomonas geniculata]
MSGGRPSSYKAEFSKQAEKLCLLGATDQELADFFEVDVRTIYRWKGDYPEFCQALKAGKEEADTRVERSLYQQAIGYEQDEVKIFMPAGAEGPVYAPYRAKIAPNVTAAIFWLKNRRGDDWREKQHTELTGANGGPVGMVVSVTVNGVEPGSQ